jgi:translation initiation factor IF-2
MQDDKGRRLKKATPSTPVEIIGLSDVPQASDSFQVVEDERLAKQITQERTALKREENIQSRGRISLEDLFNQIKEGEVQDLNIIIKADVQGSIEATCSTTAPTCGPCRCCWATAHCRPPRSTRWWPASS